MHKITLIIFFLFAFSTPVHADVTVTDKALQKGLFSPPKCNNQADCLCESDIRYPVISGMENKDAQAKINTDIKRNAEQLLCQGEEAKIKSTGNNFSVMHGYEVTYRSPQILSFKFSDWAYEGGAHGNGTLEGMIIDLTSGKILSVDDIFSAQNLPEVNQVIYDALAPKSEGVFRDEIESRKGSFIRDGKCRGCTLVVAKEGVEVIFQSYEVAPFADGNPTIAIPGRLVSYPAITQVLGKK